jgi:hypothetical protein
MRVSILILIFFPLVFGNWALQYKMHQTHGKIPDDAPVEVKAFPSKEDLLQFVNADHQLPHWKEVDGQFMIRVQREYVRPHPVQAYECSTVPLEYGVIEKKTVRILQDVIKSIDEDVIIWE